MADEKEKDARPAKNKDGAQPAENQRKTKGAAKKTGLVQWQRPMTTVLTAAIPPILGSVYFFGLRSLFVLAVCCGIGFLCEWFFLLKAKRPVSSAVFVTAVLFSLTLPPKTPILIAIFGIVIAVVFGKMAFGGFGSNAFNPALVGRCFIYINFPKHMTTSDWSAPFAGGIGGFAHWTNADAFTGATPLAQFKEHAALTPLAKMFLGNIGGSFGETSALLILIGAAYLLYKKTANWRIMVSVLASAFVFSGILHFCGVRQALPPQFAIFAGGMMFGAVYMATDPVSAARTPVGMYIYGTLIGVVAIIIRCFSGFPEGVNFAILMGNMFAPITDYAVRALQKQRKAAAKKTEEEPAETGEREAKEAE